MKAIDLHSHTTRSDGTYTPTEQVAYALEKGLAALAITDHDTTDGIDEAVAAAKGKPIEVVPGIEFSTEYMGTDVHVVGLYVDHKGPAFTTYLKDFQDSRTNRNLKMCQLLTDHGMPITFEELQAAYPGAIITRAHYGKFLLAKGYVKTISEAFEKYIGDGCPCFLPREAVTPIDAVKLILEAGGIPILAHPILYHFEDAKLEGLITSMKEAGLIGIEAIYSTYTPADERKIRGLAKKYDLLISGGSDFHGANKPGLDLGTGYGHLFVPEEVLTKLKAYLANKKA